MRNDNCTSLTSGIKKEDGQLLSLSTGSSKDRGLNLKCGHKETPPSYRLMISQGGARTPISGDWKSLETTDLRRWFACVLIL